MHGSGLDVGLPKEATAVFGQKTIWLGQAAYQSLFTSLPVYKQVKTFFRKIQASLTSEMGLENESK